MEKTKTIMVVEDEKPLLRAIQSKLEHNGFEVVTARDSEQAVGYLEDLGGVDVIWLDHYLLGKDDGLSFLNKVKEHKEWHKIPVFVVSNTASADKVKSYINFGVEKYYVKAEHRLDKIIEEIKNSIKD